MKLNFDCIIIGGGIAGITAALYLKRAGINTLIVEKDIMGGQINRCSKIDNYPGCEDIEGPTLAQNMLKQIKNLGGEIKYAEVKDIIVEENSKLVILSDITLSCKAVIIATGREPKKLGVPNEEQLTGKGISWCATCDGFFFRNKKVAVVGGGNSALEEALYLSNICESVKLIVRKNYMRADQYLQEQVLNTPNIEILYESVVKEVIGRNKLEKAMVKDKGKEYYLELDGLFIAIGYEPTFNLLPNLIKEDNYIIVDNEMRTNIKGIYTCGDAIKKNLYQLVTAASEGAIAAHSYIKDYHNNQTIKNN